MTLQIYNLRKTKINEIKTSIDFTKPSARLFTKNTI